MNSTPRYCRICGDRMCPNEISFREFIALELDFSTIESIAERSNEICLDCKERLDAILLVDHQENQEEFIDN